MGLDRFANFITKSINSDGVEDILLNQSGVRKVVASHVIFDINFLIYQEIICIENEINDVIKTILSIPFALNKRDIVESLLNSIFTQEHWKPYYTGNELEGILDGYNEEEIIQKFLGYITTKIENTTLLELVVYEKIINVMVSNIKEIHHESFIQSLLIFFDGIPSISKVIEQRRRRIKNHLESNEKKVMFKKYFDNLLPNNKRLFSNLSKKYINITDTDMILFDYFKWIKYRFSIDKSLGPSSSFIKNMESIMSIRIQKILPKIKVYINSSSCNGESDLKIFKYISEKNIDGDFCIHTTDSDFIHMILIQQAYNKIINNDINLTVIKYLKNYNIQILDANIIIKNIMETYNNINNIKTNNYKIIWDICLIFFFFGNDHLPSSLEIGPELGLEFFLKKHYMALEKNNIVILNKTKHYNISIDLHNLLLFFEKINESNKNNITKIILQRFFKLNTSVINLFVDKYNLDFNGIQDFLKKFILSKALEMSEPDLAKLDDNDLRKILIQTVDRKELDGFKTIENLQISKLIEDNLDYYMKDFMGLSMYTRPHIMTNDPYQDIYNFISDKATLMLTKKYPLLYDHIDIMDHLHFVNTMKDCESDTNDYLKKIFHLTTSQFGCMKDFHTDNIMYYKYNHVPRLESLIEFIRNIQEPKEQINKWIEEINGDNIKTEDYITSINHHLIITPFNELIDGNFEYRNLDIRKYITNL